MERCLVEQVEPGLALGLEQGLQLRLLLGGGDLAPVQIFDRRAARFVDNLQHAFADVPAERGAQGFVAGDNRLPGLDETLRIELAVDAVAILHVVQARARFQQGVQQHAFLHGRQRVDVFDQRCRNRQCIQLRLVQFRQREVRRRQAARVIAQAVLDQAAQLTQVSIGQFADGLGRIAFGAEGPAQHQFAAVDLTVDAQFIRQRRLRIKGRANRFIQRMEQCIGRKALVELTQVVEGNRRRRQLGHALAGRLIGQITQHAIAQPFVRYGAQLLLDRLDRGALPGHLLDVRGCQAQRVGAGEPADGAGQVDVVEQRLATMAFKLNQRRRVTVPTAEHAGQCSQQQVVDVGAICTRRLLQQLPSALAVEAHADGLRMAMLATTLRSIAGQLGARPGQLRLPPAQFFTQGFAAGIGLQAGGPVLEGTGLGRHLHRLLCVKLAIDALQIFQQHAP